MIYSVGGMTLLFEILKHFLTENEKNGGHAPQAFPEKRQKGPKCGPRRGSFLGVGEVGLSTFAKNGPNIGPFCSFFPEKRQKGPKCGPWRGELSWSRGGRIINLCKKWSKYRAILLFFPTKKTKRSKMWALAGGAFLE